MSDRVGDAVAAIYTAKQQLQRLAQLSVDDTARPELTASAQVQSTIAVASAVLAVAEELNRLRTDR